MTRTLDGCADNSANAVLARALVAFFALPGVAAVAVPYRYTRNPMYVARTHGEGWERYARRVPR